MRTADLIGHSLSWQQPSLLGSEYGLHLGEDIIGTLRFRSSWGSLATAEILGGCWTFKRIGFLQTRVSIKVCGTEPDIAIFRNNTWKGGGTLEFPDGRRLPASTNFWHSRYEF